jgi:hypothetical protein
VLLKDDASAGRVIVPLRPFLRFSRRLEKQLSSLEKRVQAAVPQLANRGKSRQPRSTAF